MPKYQETEQRVSAAIGQVLRLNKLLDLAADYAMDANAYSWFRLLQQIKRELRPWMTVEEKIDFWNRLQSIKGRYVEVNTAQNGKASAPTQMRTDLYKELNDMDEDLRVIAYKNNLLVAKPSSFEEGLSEQFQY